MKSRFFEIQIVQYDLLVPLDDLKYFHPEIETFYQTRGYDGKYYLFLYLKKSCEQTDVAEWFSDNHFQAVLTTLKDQPNCYRLELRRKLNINQLSMTI